MCGLIGYVGRRDAPDILLAGLRRLEYRGYDSAGICVQGPSTLVTTRAIGSLDNLDNTLNGNPVHLNGRYRPHALGHTRTSVCGKRPSFVRLPRGRIFARPERNHRELPRAPERVDG